MHPQREELAAYLVGALAEPNAHTIEGHVQTCPECEATINQLGNQDDTMLEKLRRGPPQNGAEAESACIAMVEVIKDIGRDPTFPGAAASPAAAELGNLREYKLLKKLGEGGMGAVYRALHTKLDKVVALKVLPGGRLQNSDAVARFEREMKAVGKLRHPNIVGAFDAGEANGMHFLVMELVDGENLSTIIKQHAPLAIADACELVRQVAVGLQEAHEHGMVHRDIKPSNLMLTVEKRKSSATGIVKILDMGLALLDASQPGKGELTGTGQLMGTLHYMAPEQANDTHTVDIRADIYSLGVVLYELLTGKIPLEAKRNEPMMSKLMALTQEPNRSIRELRSDLPQSLVALVDRMLAKKPAERPATPEEVATALEPFAADHHLAGLLDGAAVRAPVAAAPASRSQPAFVVKPVAATTTARRGPPRNTTRIAAGFAAFFFVALGVWFIVRDKDGNEIGRIELPKGGSITVESEGGPKTARETKVVAPKVETATSTTPIAPTKMQPPIAGRAALRFDMPSKASSEIQIPSLRLSVAGPLTVEGYVKIEDPNKLGPNQFFGTRYQMDVSRDGFVWYTSPPEETSPKGQERFVIGAGGWKKNTWQHVAAVRDGKEHRLYIDGVSRGTAPAPETLSYLKSTNYPSGTFFIGSSCHGVAIREVRVSSVARYTKTFSPADCFETDAQTLALYHLDEGKGDLLHDASGNGLDARLNNTGETWVSIDAK